MLDSIKRWLGASSVQIQGWSELASWARAQQHTLRAVREPEGFVIDGRSGDAAWRLEWGPPQRPYIHGPELRIRAELAVPRELQALVLNRELMAALEKAVFDQYVEGVQTRIDTATPPEMRWLVMFQKLSGQELKSLRDGWGALSSFKPWLQQWLDGALSPALAALPTSGERPLVLMIARRRLSLRTVLAHPEPRALQAWLGLFECALQQAQRVAVDDLDAHTPSTQPSMFPASALPADALRP
ncbi:MAG TPA: hypothetical protein PKB14_01020 [Rubrivivax sp.]|nr:hypothetical protein [Rubrivivax sp.]